MAYSYLIKFDIGRDKMSQLQIGSSLERALGYLKTLLPSQDGFLEARALYSLENRSLDEPIHLIFFSSWDTWADLKRHVDSSLSEDKILKEFEPHVKLLDLETQIFNDVR